MPDTNDTGPAPPAAPAVGLPGTETRESLDMLREIERRRLAEEAAAEQARREREAAERAEAERHNREAAAERARQADVDAAERQRAEAADAERARLLDVDCRLTEQERMLRAEFDGERTRLTAELCAARSAFRRIATPVAGFAIAVSVFAVVLNVRLGRAEREHVRVLATIERLERTVREIHDQHTATTQQAAVLDRDLTETRGRAARAETRVQELERAAVAPRVRAGSQRTGTRTNASRTQQRPDPPKITTGITDDPIEGLYERPPKGQ